MLTLKQYLIELHAPDYYSRVWRSFSVPLKRIWSSTSSDFHNPNFTNSYNGCWVSLTPEYATRYGKDLGSVNTLSLPLLCEFEVSKNIINRPAKQHTDDDAEIEGQTMKIHTQDLKRVVDVKMCIDGQHWIPYNKRSLFKLLRNPTNLQQLLNNQEIEVPDCPTPDCITHTHSITSLNTLLQVCPICKDRFGISALIK